ncbi:hypothetical protein ACWGSK_24050 [Nocardiopsis sp. NPDC055551]
MEDLPSSSLDEATQRDLLTGISTLLLSASRWSERSDTAGGTESTQVPAREIRVSVTRWKVGHHLFHLLLSIMNRHSDDALAALREEDWHPATSNIDDLTSLLDSATAAMHYASDFPRESYEGIIRPSMEPPWMPSGFSGIFNQDHQVFESNLKELRKAGKSPNMTGECRSALKQLWRAQSKNRRDHRNICEKFVPGGDSILQQHFANNNEKDSD